MIPKIFKNIIIVLYSWNCGITTIFWNTWVPKLLYLFNFLRLTLFKIKLCINIFSFTHFLVCYIFLKWNILIAWTCLYCCLIGSLILISILFNYVFIFNYNVFYLFFLFFILLLVSNFNAIVLYDLWCLRNTVNCLIVLRRFTRIILVFLLSFYAYFIFKNIILIINFFGLQHYFMHRLSWVFQDLIILKCNARCMLTIFLGNIIISTFWY
jgi:hypothetical protein